MDYLKTYIGNKWRKSETLGILLKLGTKDTEVDFVRGSVVKLIGISLGPLNGPLCVNMVWQVIGWGRPRIKSVQA